MRDKRTLDIRIKVTPSEKEKYQLAADKCCRGNISDFFRKSAEGGHAARMIHGKQLEELIHRAVKEANASKS